MKWLANLGGWFWVFAALLGAAVAVALVLAVLRARGPWNPIERPLSIALCLIAGACPVFGLVGTIASLMSVFRSLGPVSAEQKQQVLSDGIAAAMDCTAIGLGLALPLGLLAIVLLVTGAKRDPNRRPRPASG